MTEPLLTANGLKLRALTLRVATVGVWCADVEPQDGELAGACELRVGAATLRGTVVEQQAGTFATRTAVRVVGGAGGWGRTLGARHYHNDAGVKARLVAEDAAREAGETLGSFLPGAERVGLDYTRRRGSGWAALEHVAGGQPWWVDYAGVTNVGPRAENELAASAYTLLDYDPASRVAQLAVDDAAALQIGSVLTDQRLPTAQVVRDFEISTRDNSPLRATAWCGLRSGTQEQGRLLTLLRSLVERAMPQGLYGHYRYRVVGMAGDGRVQLQAVRREAGLPDLTPIAQWPGVAGAHAVLTPGAEVLVAFVDGDPGQPIVSHYGGKDAPGWVPVTLTLGGETGSPAARVGDTVTVLLPPATLAAGVFSGTIGGAPATGTVAGQMTFPQSQAVGVITSGSSKVRIAS